MNVDRAADLLLSARRSGIKLHELPADCRPADDRDAYAIQMAIARRRGDLAGWKMGRFAPDEPSVCAPLFHEDIFASGWTLDAKVCTPWLLEVEVGLWVMADIDGSSRGSDADLLRKVEAFALIEVLTGRYADLRKVSRGELLADSNANGAIIWGEPAGDGTLSPDTTISLAVEHGGRRGMLQSSGAEVAKLLHELLDCLDARGQKLTAGQIVATGTIGSPMPAVRAMNVRSNQVGAVSVAFL